MKQAQASGNTVLRKKNVFSRMLAQWDLQILVVPGILLVLLFSYVPMYGVVMGFQDFQLGDFPGFSQWVGFKHFQTMFADKYFGLAMRNTLVISALKMFIGFPLPILFAVLLNEMNFQPLKKTVQTVSYLPHFISWVVCATLMFDLMSTDGGAINEFLMWIGVVKEPIGFFTEGKYFWGITLCTDIWKELGWNAIIFISAITSISQDMYEAADIDGATRAQKMWHITIKSIKPTIILMFIFQVGGVLMTGMLAFAISRTNLVGKKVYAMLCLIPMYFGGGLMPTYFLILSLGLKNNFLVYIIPALVNLWNMILMRSYFQSLPEALEESALIDGANYITLFFKIYFPLSTPIIATIALYFGVQHWNDWFQANLYITQDYLKPMQNVLLAIVNEAKFAEQMSSAGMGVTIDGNALKGKQTNVRSITMATMFVTIIPIIIVYPFLQRYFVKGIMIGSVKG